MCNEANHYVDTNGDVQDCPANSAVSGGILLEAGATISGAFAIKDIKPLDPHVVSAQMGKQQMEHIVQIKHSVVATVTGYFVDDSDHSCKECSVGGSTAEGGDPNGAATSCDCAANYRVNANAECELCQPGETNAPLDQTQGGET